MTWGGPAELTPGSVQKSVTRHYAFFDGSKPYGRVIDQDGVELFYGPIDQAQEYMDREASKPKYGRRLALQTEWV